MGRYVHRAVIATLPPNMPGSRWGDEYDKIAGRLKEFRESLPGDDWRALVVGPVQSVTNSFEWVLFMPDGSKEGWDTSDEGDGHRERFIEAMGGSALVASWGDDDPRLVEVP